ncbi:hypothetical protein HAX54_007330 [Datura stramonium]|uniref:Uncharacterized protein n=1 Tax=Datura stramonium TaxID=4076 RepID=A0ABS8TBL1_DATST|nr:hypothetical protein [Datura stramonium]
MLIANNLKEWSITSHAFKVASEMLEKFAKTNRAWYNIESKTKIVNHSREVPAELQRRNMERDQDMDQIKAKMELITKHLSIMNAHNVQAVNMQRETYRYGNFYPDYDEKVDFVNHHIEDFQACTPVSNSGNCSAISGIKVRTIMIGQVTMEESKAIKEIRDHHQTLKDDQCIAIETRRGRTTFKQQTLETRSTAEENNPRPMEIREQGRAFFYLHTKRRNVPAGQGIATRDVPQEKRREEHDAVPQHHSEDHNAPLDRHSDSSNTIMVHSPGLRITEESGSKEGSQAKKDVGEAERAVEK